MPDYIVNVSSTRSSCRSGPVEPGGFQSWFGISAVHRIKKASAPWELTLVSPLTTIAEASFILSDATLMNWRVLCLTLCVVLSWLLMAANRGKAAQVRQQR